MTSIDKAHSSEESLEQALKEMKLMRKGEMKKVTWEELKKILESNN